jgi:hypothetical protein
MPDGELQRSKSQKSGAVEQAFVWYEKMPKTGRIVSSLVGIGTLFSFGSLFFSQFTQARNVVNNLEYSRVMLGLLYVVLVLMFLVPTVQIWRCKYALTVSLAAPLIVVIALDIWAPKPHPAVSPSRASREQPCIANDPQYVPPKGKGIRVEMNSHDHELPESMCPSHGMSDIERIDCLCPSRLQYSLRALPPPSDSNFETEVTVKKVCLPIYKARVFFRDAYTRTGYITMVPYEQPESHVTGGFEEAQWDKTSFLIKSSAPEDEFHFSVLTATGLRILCINQMN